MCGLETKVGCSREAESGPGSVTFSSKLLPFACWTGCLGWVSASRVLCCRRDGWTHRRATFRDRTVGLRSKQSRKPPFTEPVTGPFSPLSRGGRKNDPVPSCSAGLFPSSQTPRGASQPEPIHVHIYKHKLKKETFPTILASGTKREVSWERLKHAVQLQRGIHDIPC